jgi:hypothetical protein
VLTLTLVGFGSEVSAWSSTFYQKMVMVCYTLVELYNEMMRKGTWVMGG